VAATPMTAAMVTAALVATAAKIKPQDAKPFRKGDAVVYPTHGVGHVDPVGFEEIAGHRLHLIHISFQDSRMTLRVPVARALRVCARLPATPAMATALDALKGPPRISRRMWAKRSEEYLAKIHTSNPDALAEVVRDLQVSGDRSGSSYSQGNLFELARSVLPAKLPRSTGSPGRMLLR
jgi:CarD family transcriptional regulator